MEKQTIFDTLDPEIVQRMTTRRDALAKAGRFAAGLALASVPVAFGGLARSAFGQALPQNIIDVLNFALTLEYLEADYYAMALDEDGLIPEETMDVFQVIGDHEAAHVTLLQSVLGNNAVEKPTFDFTAGGMFDPFNDYAQFLALAQGFEDTGVRAYKGQATALMSNDMILTTALQIHSVEARHAAEVRRIRSMTAWIQNDDVDIAALAPVYAGEDFMNITASAAGVSAEQVTEAFDEPLAMDDVLAIASLFIES